MVNWRRLTAISDPPHGARKDASASQRDLSVGGLSFQEALATFQDEFSLTTRGLSTASPENEIVRALWDTLGDQVNPSKDTEAGVFAIAALALFLEDWHRKAPGEVFTLVTNHLVAGPASVAPALNLVKKVIESCSDKRLLKEAIKIHVGELSSLIYQALFATVPVANLKALRLAALSTLSALCQVEVVFLAPYWPLLFGRQGESSIASLLLDKTSPEVRAAAASTCTTILSSSKRLVGMRPVRTHVRMAFTTIATAIVNVEEIVANSVTSALRSETDIQALAQHVRLAAAILTSSSYGSEKSKLVEALCQLVLNEKTNLTVKAAGLAALAAGKADLGPFGQRIVEMSLELVGKGHGPREEALALLRQLVTLDVGSCSKVWSNILEVVKECVRSEKQVVRLHASRVAEAMIRSKVTTAQDNSREYERFWLDTVLRFLCDPFHSVRIVGVACVEHLLKTTRWSNIDLRTLRSCAKGTLKSILVDDDSPLVRAEAARTLGFVGDDDPKVCSSLMFSVRNDSVILVRIKSFWSLCSIARHSTSSHKLIALLALEHLEAPSQMAGSQSERDSMLAAAVRCVGVVLAESANQYNDQIEAKLADVLVCAVLEEKFGSKTKWNACYACQMWMENLGKSEKNAGVVKMVTSALCSALERFDVYKVRIAASRALLRAIDFAGIIQTNGIFSCAIETYRKTLLDDRSCIYERAARYHKEELLDILCKLIFNSLLQISFVEAKDSANMSDSGSDWVMTETTCSTLLKALHMVSSAPAYALRMLEMYKTGNQLVTREEREIAIRFWQTLPPDIREAYIRASQLALGIRKAETDEMVASNQLAYLRTILLGGSQ